MIQVQTLRDMNPPRQSTTRSAHRNTGSLSERRLPREPTTLCKPFEWQEMETTVTLAVGSMRFACGLDLGSRVCMRSNQRQEGRAAGGRAPCMVLLLASLHMRSPRDTIAMEQSLASRTNEYGSISKSLSKEGCSMEPKENYP